jgi:predicted amidophosphoribosyltransferase
MICTLCETLSETVTPPPWICPNCASGFGAEVPASYFRVGSDRVTALFDYGVAVRQLILRSKTRNDASALVALLKLSAPKVTDWLSSRQTSNWLVVPAPSSLWGRLKGRFDVARMVAECFFPRDQILQTSLPGSFFRGKRAGQNETLDSDGSEPAMAGIFNKNKADFKRISSATHIVVVDDVMTTGLTMRSSMNLLKSLGAQTVEGLVVASSNKDLTSDEH